LPKNFQVAPQGLSGYDQVFWSSTVKQRIEIRALHWPRQIRVNTLISGLIETSFRAFMGEEGKRAFEQMVIDKVPLGRIGTVDEAAAVALFLLSDDSAYVTGSQYPVDGGLLRR